MFFISLISSTWPILKDRMNVFHRELVDITLVVKTFMVINSMISSIQEMLNDICTMMVIGYKYHLDCSLANTIRVKAINV